MPAHTKTSGPAKPPCTRYALNVFFPDRESSHLDQPTPGEQAALGICASCPLASRLECLAEALTYPIKSQNGIVGGTTALQRKTILRGRRQEQLAGLAR